MSIYLSGGATYLPPTVITNDFFPQSTVEDGKRNLMFAGTKERRHCGRDEKASEMLVKATQKLLNEQNLKASDIGLLINNVTHLDIPFNGIGGAWAKGLEIAPNLIYDIHNTGCTSFVYMIQLAQTLMESFNIDYALIGNVQSSAGKLFAQEQNLKKPQSVVPGDGAGVVLLRREKVDGDGKVIGFATKSHPEFSEDMYIERPDGSYWWEPSESMGIIEFPKARAMRILSRGNRSVPERIREVCETAHIEIKDIDHLITNQPNATFLRNWREFCELPEERHYESYSSYGNLFGAAMPINYSETLDNDGFSKGDKLCFAGFSHAGDYSSAMIVQF